MSFVLLAFSPTDIFGGLVCDLEEDKDSELRKTEGKRDDWDAKRWVGSCVLKDQKSPSLDSELICF